MDRLTRLTKAAILVGISLTILGAGPWHSPRRGILGRLHAQIQELAAVSDDQQAQLDQLAEAVCVLLLTSDAPDEAIDEQIAALDCPFELPDKPCDDPAGCDGGGGPPDPGGGPGGGPGGSGP